MGIGILTGLTAAILNSVGYLFGSRFLLHYKSPVRLLFLACACMMCISIPFLLIMLCLVHIDNISHFLGILAIWFAVFLTGQGAFFASLKFFEASRLSSLLGLKIIVLAVIFVMTTVNASLGVLQWGAVLLAAIAAMAFNWSGTGKTKAIGWLLLCTTLVCYSLADINETRMIEHLKACGNGSMVSSLTATFIAYTALGAVCLPLSLIFFPPDARQVKMAMPYALLWLLSQIFLFVCFASIRPVFGNVILATRGIFSVIIGALLPLFGLGALDSKIPMSKWIQRGFASLLMAAAIALYSWGTQP